MHPELTMPSFPARSRLIRLAPVGVGTARTESQTGYIARLAGAHRVSTGTLLSRGLARHLGPEGVSDEARAVGRTRLPTTYLRSINRMDPVAAAWTRMLEDLTCRSGLRFLTMLTWAEVLPNRGLFRGQRAWCPDCYRDDAIVHEHLLWNLYPVTVCPHHRRPLETRCPHCHKALPTLSWRSVPGFCSSCAHWLGTEPTEPAAINASRVGSSPAGVTRDCRLAADFGALLAVAPGLERPPDVGRIPEALTILAGCGDVPTLAQRLGVSYLGAWAWNTGRMRPVIPQLLSICERLGVSLTDLLTAPASTLASAAVNLPPVTLVPGPVRGSRAAQAAALKRVRADLQRIVNAGTTPPPSFRETCARLGHAKPVLYRNFPDLCRAISARWLAWRRNGGAERRERLTREVREVATRLHGNGVDPSTLNVARALAQPGAIRDQTARLALRETRERLGLPPR